MKVHIHYCSAMSFFFENWPFFNRICYLLPSISRNLYNEHNPYFLSRYLFLILLSALWIVFFSSSSYYISLRWHVKHHPKTLTTTTNDKTTKRISTTKTIIIRKREKYLLKITLHQLLTPQAPVITLQRHSPTTKAQQMLLIQIYVVVLYLNIHLVCPSLKCPQQVCCIRDSMRQNRLFGYYFFFSPLSTSQNTKK